MLSKKRCKGTFFFCRNQLITGKLLDFSRFYLYDNKPVLLKKGCNILHPKLYFYPEKEYQSNNPF